LVHLQRALGLALGGEPGSRLAAELAAPTSGDTILRRVKATPAEPETSYRFIGIDDFALRKGHTYGTVLVDLQRGRVIDLFDGRDGAPVAAWLKLHPGVEVITRDRWAAYANARSAGAPQATQVADRFHLIGNIRELVERLFEQHAPALDAALEPPAIAAESCLETALPPAFSSEQTSTTPPPTTVTCDPNDPLKPATDSPPVRSHRQQRRQDRFEEVRRLRREGQSIRRIARALRISSKTVLRYARCTQCPDWNPGVPRGTRLDRFASAVDAFIREGGRTATVLHRRLAGQGCRSSYCAVLRFLGRRLREAGLAPVGSSRGPPRPRRPPARALSFEFVRRAEDRSDEETKRMTTVTAIPELCGSLGLASELLEMTRGSSKTPLSDWLARAETGGSRLVQSFAEALRTDSAAVQAALSTSWSNGPVEGHVNRLKCVKRTMYGRAGLALLRARVRAKS
jgi:transposase